MGVLGGSIPAGLWAQVHSWTAGGGPGLAVAWAWPPSSCQNAGQRPRLTGRHQRLLGSSFSLKAVSVFNDGKVRRPREHSNSTGGSHVLSPRSTVRAGETGRRSLGRPRAGCC